MYLFLNLLKNFKLCSIMALLFILANDLGFNLNFFDNLDPLPADSKINYIKKNF